MNRQSGSPLYTGIIGAIEGIPCMGSFLANDGVSGPEDEGGDGMEKFEREGDGESSGPFGGSLVEGLAASSTAALTRWRL